MGNEETLLKPEDAIAVLQETRHHREQLTSRAAGILWVVWGLVLTMFIFGDTALVVAQNAGLGENHGWGLMLLTTLVLAGAALSNMVWRAHALEVDAQHKSWVAWLLVVAIVVLTILINQAAETWIFKPLDWQTPTRLSPVLYLVAGIAIALTVVLRHRVNVWPGSLAAALIIVVSDAMIFVSAQRNPSNELQWSLGLGIFTLLVFFAVGLWHYRRG